MIHATGVFTVMVAGAAMASVRAAEAATRDKNGRDLLFKSYFSFDSDGIKDSYTYGSDGSKDSDNTLVSDGSKDGSKDGFVRTVYDHFSKYQDGYQEDDGYVRTDDPFVKTKGHSISKVDCHSYASAKTYDDAKDAHISYARHAILEFCKPDWDGKIKHMYHEAEDFAAAVARAVTSSQSACVSAGNAFGCASATAIGVAWAEAKAEAHVTAVAKAFSECEEAYGCPINADSLAVSHAKMFIDLSADVFSRSEVYACSKYNSGAIASAYSNCVAVAYAKMWTEAYATAYLQTGCASNEAATAVGAQIKAEYYTIEGCDRDGGHDSYGFGTSGHTTYGSSAEASAYEFFPKY